MWEYISKYLSENLYSKMFCPHISDMGYTYEQVLLLSIKHGEGLKSVVKAGCKCAIMCDCEFNTVIAILAAWYANLVPVPISKKYGRNHCNAILRLTEPEILIVDNDQSCSQNINLYNIKNANFMIVHNDFEPDPFLMDAAVIMCTSGTTGTPKGIVITISGLINNVLGIKKYFNIGTNDTILIARPIYHAAVLSGELLISLIQGLNIVIYDNDYSPSSIIQTVRDYKATVMCGTPTLFRQICLFLENSKEILDIKNIVLSGECLRQSVAKRIRQSFCNSNIYSVYGLTEASPRVSYLPPVEFDSYSESVGIPLYGSEIKIVNDNWCALAPYNRGLIIVKSSSIMKGYYKNPDLTKRVIRNGWLITGDCGYMDNDGRLYVDGRIDDLIIKGGMNIYPKEIENNVLKLDEIDDCMAYGFYNGEIQSLGIDVVLNGKHASLSNKEVKLLISLVLPRYQMPNKISIVQEIARNASGKIIRKTFRKQ